MNYREKKYRTMLLTVKNHIATVTLNRPEALNASNLAMGLERTEILEGLAEDSDVRVVVLTGGENVFSSGGDLTEMLNFDTAQAKRFSDRILLNQRLLVEMPKPTIASVAGVAYGGGFEQILMCDLCVAAENAKFCMPEIHVGLFPGGGATQRMPRVVPMHIAKELIMLGEPIDVWRGYELGFVNKVVPLEELMNATYAIAENLAKKSPYSMRMAKMCLQASQNCSMEAGLHLESSAWATLFGVEENKRLMGDYVARTLSKAGNNHQKANTEQSL